MDADENLPLRKDNPLAKLVREDLDPYSLAELADRIEILKSEITRCEAKKAAATVHKSAADQLFKKG
jgi:uncharacterized small protein (DUF1192 family)